MTTVFPEARVKKYIEMRGADGGSWRRLTALSAFWVGLMYDGGALDAAWDLVKGWDAETRDGLRREAAKSALAGAANGVQMRALAGQVVEIARAGLKARGRTHGVIADEAHFLDPLVETVASGRTPADNLLDRYAGDWQGDLSRIYADYSY